MKRVLKHRSPEKLKLLFNSYLTCEIPQRYSHSKERRSFNADKRSNSNFSKISIAEKVLEQKRHQHHKAMVYQLNQTNDTKQLMGTEPLSNRSSTSHSKRNFMNPTIASKRSSRPRFQNDIANRANIAARSQSLLSKYPSRHESRLTDEELSTMNAMETVSPGRNKAVQLNSDYNQVSPPTKFNIPAPSEMRWEGIRPRGQFG